MADERVEVEVEVRYGNQTEKERARAALAAVRPDDVRVLAGTVEGWADANAVMELLDGGLDFTRLGHPAAERDEPLEGLSATGAPEPGSDELDELRRQTRFVARRGDGFALLEEEVRDDALDPTIHDVGPRKVQPDPEEALDAAVYHIRLGSPPTEEQTKTLESLGISLAAWEPRVCSYRTFLTRDQYVTVRDLPFVKSVERFRLEETVTRELLDSVSGDSATLLSAEDGPPTETYDCVLHRIADRESTDALIRSFPGVEVLESSYLYIRFRAPADARILAAIAKLPEVRRLTVYEPPELMSNRARVMTGVESAEGVIPEGLTGEGEKVAVFDSGIDRNHPDLVDRVESIQAVPEATEEDCIGHGTHVAGTIAGTGAASGGKIKGIAPKAKLDVVGFVKLSQGKPVVLTPADWPTLLQRAVDKGAKIVNLSMGSAKQAWYDFGSLSMDQFVWDHPDVLVVVAAGNAGSAPEGFCWLKNVYSPGSAKNVLTVGASCSDRKLDPPATWGERFPSRFTRPPCSEDLVCGGPDAPAALNSRGPTEFDSVKPDLVAPGTQILAPKATGIEHGFWKPEVTEHDGKYAYLGGTSMAAPVVSGAAALVRQYLRVACGNPAPSAALMKAILIAAARRIAPRPLPEDYVERIGFPDFDQGFGRLDLATIIPSSAGASPRRRLLFADVSRDSPDALTSRPREALPQSKTYCVEVSPDATEPLQVVLVWTDWPSSHVQNNLHLDVRAEALVVSGNPEHRYKRKREEELADMVEASRRTEVPLFDKNNNVEKITIESPKPGEYCIRVLAQNTPFPPQGYALCIVGEIEGEMRTVA